MLECKHCKFVGPGELPGYGWIEAVLYLFYLIPGVIYSVWRRGKGRHVCPRCHTPFMVSHTQVPQPRAELESDSRKCPFCAETIKAEARICRFCDRELRPNVADSLPISMLPEALTTASCSTSNVADSLPISMLQPPPLAKMEPETEPDTRVVTVQSKDVAPKPMRFADKRIVALLVVLGLFVLGLIGRGARIQQASTPRPSTSIYGVGDQSSSEQEIYKEAWALIRENAARAGRTGRTGGPVVGKAALLQRYSLTPAELDVIFSKGLRNHWPMGSAESRTGQIPPESDHQRPSVKQAPRPRIRQASTPTKVFVPPPE